MRKIHKRNTQDSGFNIDLLEEKKFIPSDKIVESIDCYNEYVKEKDASRKYRLIFTINPVCSNILFNPCTEIVYNEGGDSAFSVVGTSPSDLSGVSNCPEYIIYKYGEESGVTREDMISDTAYSSPDIGPFVYHCGVDIFNNHMLRKNGFSVINKLQIDESGVSTPNECFNTISDNLRDSNGETVKEYIPKTNDANTAIPYTQYDRHVYMVDTVKSFQRTVNDELIESDGWVGFLNPSTLNIPNVFLINETGETIPIVINKCMNNNKPGEQIDMYPDRSLYSFIPKLNKQRKRLEYNWDYCLTYPYENFYDNELIQKNVEGYGVVNGIKCKVISKLTGTIFENEEGEEQTIIILKSSIRNTFQPGDFINLSAVVGRTVYETNDSIRVESVGYLGDDTAHCFGITVGSLYGVIGEVGENILDENGYLNSEIDIRVRKYTNGGDCKYYLRKFKKVPNFNGSDVLSDDLVTDDEINEYASVPFGSTVNKLAFSENIFSDNIAQIIFNEDVLTYGLKDNLGREVSEIYLTIIKRNVGATEWYDDKDYGNEKIEFSHCFGSVSSGFDLAPDETDYNVHKMHNVKNPSYYKVQDSVLNLETGVTIEGDDNEFFGDIVEFSPNEVIETVLEDVYHRFNTVQREVNAEGYDRITYTDLIADDYDIFSEFQAVKKTLYDKKNIASPEGYYYKPHYRVLLSQFGRIVHQGSHRRMSFAEITYSNGSCSALTSVNYYLNVGDKILLYRKSDNKKIYGVVTSVDPENFNSITFDVTIGRREAITDYGIFKINPEKPAQAYELDDGTGRYLWRDRLSDRDLTIGDELYDSMFTNGAHYFTKSINFYLRRQDPTGEYGLNTSPVDIFTGAAEGKIKDVSVAEYISEDENGGIC